MSESDLMMATQNVSLLRMQLGRQPQAVVRAKQEGGGSVRTCLLAHKADPNIHLTQQKPAVTANEISLQGATPLLLAAEVKQLRGCQSVAGCRSRSLATTAHGTTALMLASGGGTDVQRMRTPEERATAVETAKLLIERGADVSAVGQYGWTALHAAAYQG